MILNNNKLLQGNILRPLTVQEYLTLVPGYG